MRPGIEQQSLACALSVDEEVVPGNVSEQNDQGNTAHRICLAMAWEPSILGHVQPSSATPHFTTAMRLPLLSVVLAIAATVNALHFYLDANQKRCFIEELPTDTVVEGMFFHPHWYKSPEFFVTLQAIIVPWNGRNHNRNT